MSRRSLRLMSGGYYPPEEELDSSGMTNISYNENPVKVFKKKAGTRRASSNASSPSQESPVTAGQCDATPPSTRSQTAACGPSVPPEKSPYPGHYSPSMPGLHLRPNHKELSQSGVGSSGYSSSEGLSDAPSSGYRSRISSAFLGVMDSLSLMAVAAQLKIVHLKALAKTSFSSCSKKACGLFLLLLLLVLLCIWFLLPLVNSFILSGANTLSQTEPESPPVFSATAPPPPQPDTVHHEPVVDLDDVSAAVEAKMQHILLMPPPAPCPESSTAPVHNHLTPELQQAMEKWLTDRVKEQHVLKESGADFGRPMADKMADFALETQGARVISARCSETYRIRSACVTLFGFPLWYPYETPRTVIRGYPALLPGKCWAFPGVQGTLSISLSHPVRITHVTLDHLSQHNSPTGQIDSAPKDFEVYGKENDTDEGTLLGTFTYDENGEPTQTFQLPQSPSDRVYRFVELRVLSNWGHDEYTCLYRFRVHGKIAST
ncbi:nuclear migration and anchoring protein unc-84-like [Scophthalmus maximus]|uniref:nuclear migration and anchoring protein unc-84-like n=1 Tax=Scophthalmus maximus TaxID=52904 RepID=UPI001FA9230D|nr:nuclear migration and anchoring protein unc-84-like [Scophthalmus maximus]